MTGHLRLAALLALTATLASAALVNVNAAGGAAMPTPVSARTFHYTCDRDQQVSVAYVHYGADGPTFAVLNWKGVQTGLAQAVSASGARYSALSRSTGEGSGLEWWEHQGTATLSAFVDGGTLKSRPLLRGCKVN
ncbi:MliC family protein [Deinococcus aerolatus]|nr:MliC family protein [Deinococcus aerolatus]